MAAYNKHLLKAKQQQKQHVTDIFQTLRWSGVSNFAGQYMKVNGGNESRQLRLESCLPFWQYTGESARQRKTGAEEESQRVGSQGGGISN